MGILIWMFIFSFMYSHEQQQKINAPNFEELFSKLQAQYSYKMLFEMYCVDFNLNFLSLFRVPTNLVKRYP